MYFSFNVFRSVPNYQNYKPEDSPDAFNFETGLFHPPQDRKYLVTLTAQLANPNQGNLFSYGQLFILKNGKLTSLEHSLLVEQGKVAHLKTEIDMVMGDTLSVFVGYQIERKHVFGYSGLIDTFDGFHLEAIRFCIF